ncbi:MAG: tRNA epoxyqueuosine(34) reductase QueG [Bacteroidetes bacterium]|nr:tRNA epoxyqueuosine(34) reductase QueG [Bacteroidota bacterium]
MTLTEQIKIKAHELGFHKVGIAKAERLDVEAEHLEDWLWRDYHASMQWFEKNLQKRMDPREIVPNAQSVICVAMNYYSPIEHSQNSNEAKISRYAWGDDYHDIVLERIQMLADCIKQLEPGSENRFYVDTGPVMDKVWAARAGLGWQGKHSLLITKDFGSWVFLGEIITTLTLDYDSPIEDFCGTCTACIDACPTDAIREPYVVESSRCLSYLTIEHRGDIEEELKDKFERWVFGCDICQDICPWNRFQKETDVEQFQPRQWNIHPTFEELETITTEEYIKRFKKSPIKRAKIDGVRRNAKIAGRKK